MTPRIGLFAILTAPLCIPAAVVGLVACVVALGFVVGCIVCLWLLNVITGGLR